METTESLRRLVLEVYAAVNSKDRAALAARYASGPSASMIGTDLDEYCVGGDTVQAAFDRQFTHFGELVFEPGDVEVHAQGDAGWFIDEATVVAGEHRSPVRISGTALRADGTWRLVQTRLSIGAAAEAATCSS